MLCGVGILPDAYEEALEILLDNVPPRPAPLIKSIIEAELGKPVEELFDSFEELPIGAASIGQVHRATLKSSPKEHVVVKVQYPEVEGFFHLDLETIKSLCSIAMPDSNTDKLFDEVAKSFVSEFDYRLEAQNLRECSDNLIQGGFGKRAFIPSPVDEMCTKRVMVMQAVSGKPVKKVMSKVFEEMASSQGKTMDELKVEMKSQFEDPDKLKKFLSASPPSEAAVQAYRLFLKPEISFGMLRHSFSTRTITGQLSLQMDLR